jgi:hypothetical protein
MIRVMLMCEFSVLAIALGFSCNPANSLKFPGGKFSHAVCNQVRFWNPAMMKRPWYCIHCTLCTYSLEIE